MNERELQKIEKKGAIDALYYHADNVRNSMLNHMSEISKIERGRRWGNYAEKLRCCGVLTNRLNALLARAHALETELEEGK